MQAAFLNLSVETDAEEFSALKSLCEQPEFDYRAAILVFFKDKIFLQLSAIGVAAEHICSISLQHVEFSGGFDTKYYGRCKANITYVGNNEENLKDRKYSKTMRELAESVGEATDSELSSRISHIFGKTFNPLGRPIFIERKAQ